MIKGYEVTANEDLTLFTVKKDNTYRLARRQGLYCYCKAIQVNGPFYLCRHKLMVLDKFYANKKFRRLFNIRKRN